jgi:hypothetical protein
MTSSDAPHAPIAIVGIGCRFPGGVSTPDELAAFLRRHGDGICDVPADRYALELHHDPNDGPGKVYAARGGFLTQDIFAFDPAPFGISPREAAHIDPQQRLLLEVAWEAFEDAGIPVDTVRGTRTGVYVGGFTLDMQAMPAETAEPERAQAYDEPEDLRAWCLENICVQPPYFSLEQVEADGEWLQAEVEPVAPSPVERALVGVAETARHLAILGSCAVRRAMGGSGRIYYPVARARMLAGSPELRDEAAPLEVRVRARCRSVDERASRALADTELRTMDGRLLARFEMTYHVIPRRDFEVLFSEHAQPTHESGGHDPYGTPAESSPYSSTERSDGSSMTVDLGAIEPSACLGHFVGYPAYPVSMMARDAVAAVAAAVREREARPVRIAVVGGEASTHRFVFAGQSATLTVSPIAAPWGIEQAWRASVECQGEVAAWFEMHLALFDK